MSGKMATAVEADMGSPSVRRVLSCSQHLADHSAPQHLSFQLDNLGTLRFPRPMKHILLSAMMLAATAAFGAGAGAKVTPPYAAPDVEGTDQNGKTVKLAEVYKANPY